MNKCILITGCSSGIGHSLIQPLLEQGHTVYASLRGLEQRRTLFGSLEAQYPQTLKLLELDVTKAGDRKGALEKIIAGSGRLDVLINNAGFGVFGPFEEVTEADFREQFEVNFFSAALLTRDALPLLRASKGRILVLSSFLGQVAFPFTSLYSSSKFALEGLFEGISHEVAEFGVKIGLVLPGGHKTSFDRNRRRFTRADSPYKASEEKFFKLMRGAPDDHRAPVTQVTEKVVRLVTARHVPLRSFVGTDAWSVHCLHSLLPQSIFLPLLRAGVKIRAALSGS